jgi:hypothetical protein
MPGTATVGRVPGLPYSVAVSTTFALACRDRVVFVLCLVMSRHWIASRGDYTPEGYPRQRRREAN